MSPSSRDDESPSTRLRNSPERDETRFRERPGIEEYAEKWCGTGTVLKDHYVLESLIGEGGMGIVYKARDLEEEKIGGHARWIAIKLLKPEYRDDPALVQALLEEVTKTRDISHPNIVAAYSCQVAGPNVFTTMQYLEGKTLDVLLDEDYPGGMPWERARPIIEDIGAALSYAHQRGIIHCDLKPANVFIT